MNRKTLLFFASFLTLLTCVLHAVGTLFSRPAPTAFVGQAQMIMEHTYMPLPFDTLRPLSQLMYGGNVMISLYLLVSAALFILSVKPENYVKNIVVLNSLGLFACSAFSAMFFFAVPAVLTGLAAILGLMAIRK